MSSSADRTRQLAEQVPPSCSSSDDFPTTLLFLTDALTAFRAGEVAIRAFSARGKITTLTEKAGLIFTVSNSSAAARRVYENWRPLEFSPPVHVLRYDHRPRVNKIVDARAIAKRASILVHKDFINLARKASWHPLDAHAPVVKPFKTRIQPFVTSGRVTPLFRVIFCFSSYFEVHAALRSLVVLGKEDHEESQIPDLWLESDLFSPSNFCSHCGDQSHSTLSCEAKSDTS